MGVFDQASNPSQSSSLETAFGEDGRIGALGETRYIAGLRRTGILNDYAVYRTLGMPRRTSDIKEYKTDIDVGIANGNTFVPIDVKAWASHNGQAIYWTIPFFERPMVGLMPFFMKDKWALSRNMQMMVERYTERLPGVNIRPMVVFVPPPSTNEPPRSVQFLRFPGNIPSYLAGDTWQLLRDTLGTPRRVNPAITELILKNNGHRAS